MEQARANAQNNDNHDCQTETDAFDSADTDVLRLECDRRVHRLAVRGGSRVRFVFRHGPHAPSHPQAADRRPAAAATAASSARKMRSKFPRRRWEAARPSSEDEFLRARIRAQSANRCPPHAPAEEVRRPKPSALGAASNPAKAGD